MKLKTFSSKSSPAISATKPSNESDYSGEKLTSTIFGCLSVNARTVHYRRFYLFQMICFPFIPILALFIQNLVIFLEQINAYEETLEINQQVWWNLISQRKNFDLITFYVQQISITVRNSALELSHNFWTEN